MQPVNICQYQWAVHSSFSRIRLMPNPGRILPRLTSMVSGGSRICQRGGRQSLRQDANLLFGQFFPKTAWKWRNLALGARPSRPRRSATDDCNPVNVNAGRILPRYGRKWRIIENLDWVQPFLNWKPFHNRDHPKRTSLHWSCFRYSAFVVKYFWVIILQTVIVSLTCITIALLVKGVPDWSDPYQVLESSLNSALYVCLIRNKSSFTR